MEPARNLFVLPTPEDCEVWKDQGRRRTGHGETLWTLENYLTFNKCVTALQQLALHKGGSALLKPFKYAEKTPPADLVLKDKFLANGEQVTFNEDQQGTVGWNSVFTRATPLELMAEVLAQLAASKTALLSEEDRRTLMGKEQPSKLYRMACSVPINQRRFLHVIFELFTYLDDSVEMERLLLKHVFRQEVSETQLDQMRDNVIRMAENGPFCGDRVGERCQIEKCEHPPFFYYKEPHFLRVSEKHVQDIDDKVRESDVLAINLVDQCLCWIVYPDDRNPAQLSLTKYRGTSHQSRANKILYQYYKQGDVEVMYNTHEVYVRDVSTVISKVFKFASLFTLDSFNAVSEASKDDKDLSKTVTALKQTLKPMWYQCIVRVFCFLQKTPQYAEIHGAKTYELFVCATYIFHVQNVKLPSEQDVKKKHLYQMELVNKDPDAEGDDEKQGKGVKKSRFFQRKEQDQSPVITIEQHTKAQHELFAKLVLDKTRGLEQDDEAPSAPLKYDEINLPFGDATHVKIHEFDVDEEVLKATSQDRLQGAPPIAVIQRAKADEDFNRGSSENSEDDSSELSVHSKSSLDDKLHLKSRNYSAPTQLPKPLSRGAAVNGGRENQSEWTDVTHVDTVAASLQPSATSEYSAEVNYEWAIRKSLKKWVRQIAKETATSVTTEETADLTTGVDESELRVPRQSGDKCADSKEETPNDESDSDGTSESSHDEPNENGSDAEESDSSGDETDNEEGYSSSESSNRHSKRGSFLPEENTDSSESSRDDSSWSSGDSSDSSQSTSSEDDSGSDSSSSSSESCTTADSTDSSGSLSAPPLERKKRTANKENRMRLIPDSD